MSQVSGKYPYRPGIKKTEESCNNRECNRLCHRLPEVSHFVFFIFLFSSLPWFTFSVGWSHHFYSRSIIWVTMFDLMFVCVCVRSCLHSTDACLVYLQAHCTIQLKCKSNACIIYKHDIRTCCVPPVTEANSFMFHVRILF